ncbi:MAG: DUF5615 family PIN-like protein [Planctomycetia bacterium]
MKVRRHAVSRRRGLSGYRRALAEGGRARRHLGTNAHARRRCSALLAAAQRDSRVVLTCDKDFGELAFHWGLPASCGVVLFRFTASSPEIFLQRFKDLMEAETEIGFSGKFCVVEADRVRSRPLDRTS